MKVLIGGKLVDVKDATTSLSKDEESLDFSKVNPDISVTEEIIETQETCRTQASL